MNHATSGHCGISTTMRWLLVLAQVLVAGCATRTETRFVYQPNIPAATAAEPVAGAALHALRVVDERLDPFNHTLLPDATTLVHARNAYGQKLEATYALNRPIAEYITQAFRVGLMNEAIVFAEDSTTDLIVKIKRVDDPILERPFFGSAKIQFIITCDVAMVHRTSGQNLWQGRVSVDAPVKFEGLYSTIDDRLRAMPQVLDILVSSTLAKNSFRQALVNRQ